MLTDMDRVAIRSHLGYPPVGAPQIASGRVGRYLLTNIDLSIYDDSYSTLEFRLNRLRAAEEVLLTGAAYGAIYFGNLQPFTTSDSITITITQGVAIDEELVFTALNGEMLIPFMTRMSTAINQNTDLTAAGFTGSFPNDGSMSEFAIFAPAEFEISITMTGAMLATLSGFGKMPSNHFSSCCETGEIVYGYINICNELENAIAGSSKQLGFSQTGDVSFNMRVVRDRERLYQRYRKKLAEFLKVPIYPTVGGGSGAGRFVV